MKTQENEAEESELGLERYNFIFLIQYPVLFSSTSLNEIRPEITRITANFFYKGSFLFQIGKNICNSKRFLIFLGASFRFLTNWFTIV